MTLTRKQVEAARERGLNVNRAQVKHTAGNANFSDLEQRLAADLLAAMEMLDRYNGEYGCMDHASDDQRPRCERCILDVDADAALAAFDGGE